MTRVDIYTDGACSGNPGPGGWAAILIHPKGEREIFGAESPTTNNRMELMAAIEGLGALKSPCEVHLHTDSRYLHDGITEWLPRWHKNGWKTSARKQVKNADLWLRLDEAAQRHKIRWHWVKAHSGHDLNERADKLARAAIATLRS